MKKEQLEPLLLDYALGSLSPETAALLDAYIADRPELVQELEVLKGTVSVARKALTGRPRQLPPLRLEEPTTGRVVRFPGDVWKLAAMLLLGLGLGLSLSPKRIALPAPAMEALQEAPPRPQLSGTFWAASRLQPVPRAAAPSPAVSWHSPIKTPTLRSNL